MRRALRLVNVLVALVTLASALAVLGSDLTVPGYRDHYRDALWLVTAYAAVQVVMLAAFARDTWLVPWLALAKAAAAWLFLANFTALWPYWTTWTPARYVYQLFDWGGGGDYKKKYGVEPHIVPWFYGSKYPLITAIRDEARALFYRSQTLVGRLRGVPQPQMRGDA